MNKTGWKSVGVAFFVAVIGASIVLPNLDWLVYDVNWYYRHLFADPETLRHTWQLCQRYEMSYHRPPIDTRTAGCREPDRYVLNRVRGGSNAPYIVDCVLTPLGVAYINRAGQSGFGTPHLLALDANVRAALKPQDSKGY